MATTISATMQTAPPVPPDAPERIVVYDGVCKLCTGWARFLIRFDRRRCFRLVAAQSAEGTALLARHGLPTDRYTTMLVTDGRNAYTRSTAFIHVIVRLGLPWKLAAATWLVPAPLRDWMYDRVARNRYRLFGRHDHCLLLIADHESRLIRN